MLRLIYKTTLIFAIELPELLNWREKKEGKNISIILFFSRGILSEEDPLSCRCCKAVQLHWFNGLLMQKWGTLTNTSSLLSSIVLALPSVTPVQLTNLAENWSKAESSATSASWSTYQEATEAPWWLKTRQKPSFPLTSSWEISSPSYS